MVAFLAPSLWQGRAEVDARWPGRSRKSDGWIGDPAHQKTKSDHNPNLAGCVHATDTTVDGIDPMVYVRAACRHPATRYVIYNKKIWNRSDNFAPRRYNGSNPHTHHIHRSIEHTSAAEHDLTPLDLGVALNVAPATTKTMPPLGRTLVYRRGRPLKLMTGNDVRLWQQRMRDRGWRITVDGEYGPQSDDVCRRFQRDKRLAVDGEVGPNTWAATWLAPIT